MNTLNLENINKKSPYEVVLIEGSSSIFYFITDINVWNDKSPGDYKFKQTLQAIIEEFFLQDNEALLYVTETKDKKQAFRNRLFVRWFNTYDNHDKYLIRTAEGKMNNQMNFMAIIMRKDNPRKEMIINEFDETVRFLFDL